MTITSMAIVEREKKEKREKKKREEKDMIKIMDKIAKQHKKNKIRTVTSLDPLGLSIE